MHETICAVNEPQKNRVVASRKESSEVATNGSIQKLTARELEILKLLAEGRYYRDIGEALGISSSTVRAHLHSVYLKLQVKSRTQAVIKLHEYHQQQDRV